MRNKKFRTGERKYPSPRLPCPTCGRPGMLTPADVARHYQCNFCADRDEGKTYGMEG
jgi:hypothetical protein